MSVFSMTIVLFWLAVKFLRKINFTIDPNLSEARHHKWAGAGLKESNPTGVCQFPQEPERIMSQFFFEQDQERRGKQDQERHGKQDQQRRGYQTGHVKFFKK